MAGSIDKYKKELHNRAMEIGLGSTEHLTLAQLHQHLALRQQFCEIYAKGGNNDDVLKSIERINNDILKILQIPTRE